jgi:hypothetical protein
VEEHAYNNVEDVCNSETTTYGTPLEISRETHGTIKYDGQVENTHDATFWSTNVEDSTSLPVYDAYDDGGSSIPNYDMD